MFFSFSDHEPSDKKRVVDMVPVSYINESSFIDASSDLPSGCPAWASRLRDCEVYSVVILSGMAGRTLSS